MWILEMNTKQPAERHASNYLICVQNIFATLQEVEGIKKLIRENRHRISSKEEHLRISIINSVHYKLPKMREEYMTEPEIVKHTAKINIDDL